MKSKQTVSGKQIVSQITESKDKDGGGLLGFTINNGDGSFSNVMHSFSAENHDHVLAEISKERKAYLNNPEKHKE